MLQTRSQVFLTVLLAVTSVISVFSIVFCHSSGSMLLEQSLLFPIIYSYWSLHYRNRTKRFVHFRKACAFRFFYSRHLQ
uniref:Uncharacterized protein n=1 Tax=Ixodes ricinus TaxID=34613 RepID=A0A6B0U5C2_IXORI